MDLSAHDKVRPPRDRRWKVRAAVVGFLLAVLATISCYDLPDAARSRHLMHVHRGKATECRRLERLARSAGRVEEAQILNRSAENFDWFAEAYHRQSAQNRLSVVQLLRRADLRASARRIR